MSQALPLRANQGYYINKAAFLHSVLNFSTKLLSSTYQHSMESEIVNQHKPNCEYFCVFAHIYDGDLDCIAPLSVIEPYIRKYWDREYNDVKMLQKLKERKIIDQEKYGLE
jgi:hypothetical protein